MSAPSVEVVAAGPVDQVVTTTKSTKCCKGVHEHSLVKSNSCTPLCILSLPEAPQVALKLVDRLNPPTHTVGNGLLRAKLKRPPRPSV